MLIYAGIDEAGYGPVLGPLCVGAAVFAVDDAGGDRGAPNLWRRLDGAVCRRRNDARKRIAVDDSKKLKGANAAKRAHPLRHLERAVLAFASASGGAPGGAWVDDGMLFEHLGVAVADRPWYGSTTPLPVAQTEGEDRISRRRLERALTRAGVRCTLLRCEAVDAERFNDGVVRTGSKAAVNFAAALRHVDAIWRRWPDDHPRIVVDRQGGRTHYRAELQHAFPDAFLAIVDEEEAISRYRLERGASALTISFVKDSESMHFPVALASMTAKYVRELLMTRLNRFFQARVPALRPTAGYFEDGRRYLREIEPVVRKLRLPRQSLVRQV